MCLAVPGRVLEIEGDEPLARRAKVSFGGVIKSISLAYVPEAKIDDYVIVHVGFALSIVDEAEAQRVLAEFERAGFTMDELSGEPESAAGINGAAESVQGEVTS